jgi:hypothetical protein
MGCYSFITRPRGLIPCPLLLLQATADDEAALDFEDDFM